MRTTTEPLSEHTTLKIGGPAEIVTPTTKHELVDVLSECHQERRNYRILGAGSNLLVNDEGIDDVVIKTTEACSHFSVEGTLVVTGASLMIPQFVRKCVNNGLGGYEYLYSVPGTVGGAIYMNAGRGERHKLTISNYLTSVEVFMEGEVSWIDIDELEFEHRWSTFHKHDEWVILSATFDLPEQPPEEGNRRIKERMGKIGERERSQPNAGSVFKSGSKLPLHRIPPNGLSVDGARFVSGNRICHDGNAKFEDVKKLVNRAVILHRFVPPFEKPNIEWIIWE